MLQRTIEVFSVVVGTLLYPWSRVEGPSRIQSVILSPLHQAKVEEELKLPVELLASRYNSWDIPV